MAYFRAGREFHRVFKSKSQLEREAESRRETARLDHALKNMCPGCTCYPCKCEVKTNCFCAWCRCKLSRIEGLKDGEISHGICESCKNKTTAEEA
jgi:hypothetical protein